MGKHYFKSTLKPKLAEVVTLHGKSLLQIHIEGKIGKDCYLKLEI